MTIYYISPTGSNNNNGLSEGAPKPVSFLNSLVAGDEGVLLGGIYRQPIKIINRIGTANAPILIYNKAGEEAVVDGGWDGVTWPPLFTGPNFINVFRFGSLLDISKCEYIVVSGIIVKNSCGEGIEATMCKNVEIYNCKSYKSFGTAFSFSGNNSTPGTWYGNNYAHDIYLEDVTLAEKWHGKYAPDGTFVRRIANGCNCVNYVENSTLERITIKQAGAEGICAGRNTRNITVRSCISINTRHTGFYFQNSQNSIFDRCLLLKTTSEVAAVGRQEGFTYADEVESLEPPYNSPGSQNNIMRNCIAVNALHGVRFAKVNTNTGHVVENCTFVNCQLPIHVSPIADGFPAPSGCIIQNNIAYNSDVAGISTAAYGAGEGFTWRNNLFFGSAVPTKANGPGTLTSDPLLITPNGTYTYPSDANRYRPGAGSPVINVGYSNGLSVDYGGATRTGVPDIGAFEYVAATPISVNFTADKFAGIGPTTIQFTDLSVPSTGGIVTSWTWSYTMDGGTNWTSFSGEKNPQYTFMCPGCYGIRLTAYDSNGNSATVTKLT